MAMASAGRQNEAGIEGGLPLTSQIIVTRVTECRPVLLNNPLRRAPRGFTEEDVRTRLSRGLSVPRTSVRVPLVSPGSAALKAARDPHDLASVSAGDDHVNEEMK